MIQSSASRAAAIGLVVAGCSVAARIVYSGIADWFNSHECAIDDECNPVARKLCVIQIDRHHRVGSLFCCEELKRFRRVLLCCRPPVSTVNVSMVTNGLAWHYVKYAPDDKELAGGEKRLRLWSDTRSIPPWEWRKLSKAERDKLR